MEDYLNILDNGGWSKNTDSTKNNQDYNNGWGSDSCNLMLFVKKDM